MPGLERIPAIRRIDTDRNDLLAVEIVGEMTGADVENLYGLLEAAYAVSGQIDLLVRWPDGQDVEWSGVAEETVADARRHASRSIRRCAAVGGTGDISSLLRTVGGDAAGEYRRFSADEEAEAWAWVGATPQPV